MQHIHTASTLFLYGLITLRNSFWLRFLYVCRKNELILSETKENYKHWHQSFHIKKIIKHLNLWLRPASHHLPRLSRLLPSYCSFHPLLWLPIESLLLKTNRSKRNACQRVFSHLLLATTERSELCRSGRVNSRLSSMITPCRATWACLARLAGHWSMSLWSLWVFPKETKDCRFVGKHNLWKHKFTPEY